MQRERVPQAGERKLIVDRVALAHAHGDDEPEPEPIPVPDADLVPLAGRYNAEHAYVDVTADGDSLVLQVAYTPEGERMLREIVGELPEPMRIKLIPGDRSWSARARPRE